MQTSYPCNWYVETRQALVEIPQSERIPLGIIRVILPSSLSPNLTPRG